MANTQPPRTATEVFEGADAITDDGEIQRELQERAKAITAILNDRRKKATQSPKKT